MRISTPRKQSSDVIHIININNILHSCLSLTTIQNGTPLYPPCENENSHLHQLRFHPYLLLLKFIIKLRTDPLHVPARPVLNNLHFLGTFLWVKLHSIELSGGSSSSFSCALLIWVWEYQHYHNSFRRTPSSVLVQDVYFVLQPNHPAFPSPEFTTMLFGGRRLLPLH